MEALVLSLSEEGDSKPVLSLVRRKIPAVCNNSTQVLIKVRASKVNPSDLLNAAGGFPYTTYPRIPGRDYAGTIVSAPANPDLEGTNVFGTSGDQLGFVDDGAHAEYLRIDHEFIAPMPEGLSFEQAACLGVPYSTALLMIQRAQASGLPLEERLKILIIGGSGAVGKAISQLIPIHFVNSSQKSTFRKDGVMMLPKDEKFDLIFSTVPDTKSLQNSLMLLNKRGKLLFIATTRPKSESLQIDPLQFYRDDLSLIGINSIGCTMYEATSLMRRLSGLITTGQLQVDKQDVRRLQLTQGLQAYHEIGKDRVSTVLIM